MLSKQTPYQRTWPLGSLRRRHPTRRITWCGVRWLGHCSLIPRPRLFNGKVDKKALRAP
jgi:hypothetical protein